MVYECYVTFQIYIFIYGIENIYPLLWKQRYIFYIRYILIIVIKIKNLSYVIDKSLQKVENGL